MNKNVKLDNQKESEAVTIHGLSHDGRGIATTNGKTTFIRNALEKEIVTYKIEQTHRQYNEAAAIEILDQAPNRAIPPCEYFGTCGGCSLQHMNMSAQLEHKQKTLLDQLRHFGQVSPESLLPPLSASTLGYRRKARLGVKFVNKKNKLLVGFREKSSRYLADIEHCAVLHPSVGKRLTTLSQLIASLNHFRDIPQIEVAIGDHETALIFRHLTSLTEDEKEILIAFGKDYAFHIYLQPNSPLPIEKLWPCDHHHRLSYALPDHHLTLHFHPLDFTQINLEVNQLMINQAIQYLDLHQHDTVLDLFCGIGNFTLPIARYVHQVVGIEMSLDMISRTKENATHNGIDNACFYAADLDHPPQDVPWMKAQYNKILLDPPRVGAKAILPYFNQFSAKKIVYVSCNPATLARDAGELVHQYGYRLKQAGIMNMFAHTAHIEAMAVFDQ